MMRFAVAAIAAALAVTLVACGGGSPQDKMMAVCLRMNKDANAQNNCTCMVAKLKEKLSDSELNDLADQLNEILDKAGGNGEAAGQEIGTRVMTGQLVNSKVGGEFLAASKACAAPPNGATPTPAPTPAP